VVALCAGTASAQAPASQGANTPAAQGELVLQGDTTPRPALPTYWGDTGLWFVPTADTLPSRKWSLSVYRANFDRRHALTDVGEFGLTVAAGLSDRVEVFGSWRVGRFRRNTRPVFIPSDTEFGGVNNEYPYLHERWSRTLGEPIIAGAKFGLLAQSRGHAVSLAPRVMIKFPSGGATEASTKVLPATSISS
jgi:hypothetical protein